MFSGSFNITAVKSGKSPCRARFTGELPAVLPCVRHFAVFLWTVFQTLAFPIRSISAAEGIPETTSANPFADRPVFDGSLARAEHDGVSAFSASGIIRRRIHSSCAISHTRSWRMRASAGTTRINNIAVIMGNFIGLPLIGKQQ